MSFSSDDRRHMARALQLAARGLTTAHPNPRVGCVIARGPEAIGEGWHHRAGGPHAEIEALADVGRKGGSARGATAYVTLEPCCHTGRTPPCTDALKAAGISRVVYAAGDPNPRVNGGGKNALAAAGIDVSGGLMAAVSEQLNAGFFKRMREGRPLIRSKIAATLDGRTALADGRSQWLTGPAARADVQRWRARSGAVLTGIGTVLADDPSLNVRVGDVAADEVDQPWRVILDSRGRTPKSARTLALPGKVLVLVAEGADREAVEGLRGRGVNVETVAASPGGVDLAAAFRRLAEREINEAWVEAGPALNGALLAAGLVDELIVYQAASILGNQARGMFDMAGLPDLASRPTFRLAELRRVGDDLRLRYTPVNHGNEQSKH